VLTFHLHLVLSSNALFVVHEALDNDGGKLTWRAMDDCKQISLFTCSVSTGVACIPSCLLALHVNAGRLSILQRLQPKQRL